MSTGFSNAETDAKRMALCEFTIYLERSMGAITRNFFVMARSLPLPEREEESGNIVIDLGKQY
ncbi:MAG: hypothetical protein KDI68_11635 [Gammaproteobacteria bacterium]|nr:hypothetical protein [Gammaproteobacteria bacterium]